MDINYWHVYFSGQYLTELGKMQKLKGNSVHQFQAKSFLPGTATTLIKAELEEVLGIKAAERGLKIFIEDFAPINEDGYNDFINNNKTKLLSDKFDLQYTWLRYAWCS